MAVKGGFQTEIKLKSRSFYQNITKNYLLKKGDLLPILSIHEELSTSNASIKFPNYHFDSKEIFCYKGPEFELLNEYQKKILFKNSFTISKDINRIGFKLEELMENELPQILTSAVFPGTVQLTPSGKLIVLMRDCQVTGGYPRILQLSEKSINQFAQKTTNDTFRFSLLES